MNKVWNCLWNILMTAVVIIAVCVMIYTILSVTSDDEMDCTVFGYKMFIVVSDSMSATDFSAGDVIFVKETDPRNLKAGDIIAFYSRNEESYGETVAHKIRSLTTEADGTPGFITYGTTTGVDDEEIVAYKDVLGKYRMRIPAVGRFFSFLKTVPGYLLFILLPFMILIISQGINCIKNFKEYRKDEMTSIKEERDKLQAEREEMQRLLAEMEEWKSQQVTEETETVEQ